MPPPRCPLSLVSLSSNAAAVTLHEVLLRLESQWRPRPQLSISPRTSPLTPGSNNIINPVMAEYEDNEEDRKAKVAEVRNLWMETLPICLLEAVVKRALERIESQLSDDKDRKLILTLINIEKLKQSDLFFGVHALFECLAGTALTDLTFSPKLWFCLWEYGQIVSTTSLQDKISESLPKMSFLKQLSLAHVATDKICYLLSRHLPHLQYLNLDHSSVSDKGMKLLAGAAEHTNPAVGNSNNNQQITPSSHSPAATAVGNLKLRRLSLEECRDVSDATVWFLIQRLPELTIINYHQTFSIAEILTKECSQLGEQELARFRLKLTHFNHPFPYGLSVFDELLTKVMTVCPNITVLNIVTNDACLESYTGMKHLKSVCVELEDCFGFGLFEFLKAMGPQLEDISISCSSDSDSTFLPEGGQAFQLFNTGLRLVRGLCSPSRLKHLNIAGCGLVSNWLLEKMTAEGGKLADLKQLESLIFLSYEDDNPMQTCEEKLLLETLQGCPKLRVVSLEGNLSSFMSDQFMSRLLRLNPLDQLEILDFQGTKLNLTVATAKMVLALRNIREIRVSTWNLKVEEQEEVKAEVQRKGYDVCFRA